MTRSVKKGPYVDANILKRMQTMRKTGEPIKTWARSSTIIPDMVGWSFLVHNGRQHMRVYVTEDMVGHKLGEFAPTRIFRGHTTRKVELPGEAGAAEGAPAKGAPAGGKG